MVVETDGLVGTGDDMFRTRRRLMNHGTILASLVLDDHGSVLAHAAAHAARVRSSSSASASCARRLRCRHRRGRGAARTPRRRDDERVREAVARRHPSGARPAAAAAADRRGPDHATGRRHHGGVRAHGGGSAMIGRLNHVAIAVPDIAAAAGSIATCWAPASRPSRTSRSTACRRCSSSCPTPRSSCWAARRGLADRRIPREEPGRRHPSRLLRGRRHPRRPRPAEGAGRARARRRRAQDRRPRQAGAVPASQGFHRHAGRARAGMTIVGAIVTFVMVWWLFFFMALPFGVSAGGASAGRQCRERAGPAAAAAQGGGHDRAGVGSPPGASPGCCRAA